MRRYPIDTSVLVLGALLGSALSFISLSSVAFAADDQSVLEADHEFVQAAAKGDTATVGKVVDAEFYLDGRGRKDARQSGSPQLSSQARAWQRDWRASEATDSQSGRRSNVRQRQDPCPAPLGTTLRWLAATRLS